jgi:hypothetical protein
LCKGLILKEKNKGVRVKGSFGKIKRCKKEKSEKYQRVRLKIERENKRKIIGNWLQNNAGKIKKSVGRGYSRGFGGKELFVFKVFFCQEGVLPSYGGVNL